VIAAPHRAGGVAAVSARFADGAHPADSVNAAAISTHVVTRSLNDPSRGDAFDASSLQRPALGQPSLAFR
jgi:hypothetical protein